MILRSIRDIDVRGKRVILRAGLNVPVRDGVVLNDFRLRKALSTIVYLSSRGARTVIVSHLGREDESLRPVYETLKGLLKDVRIIFSEASPGEELLVAQESLRDGDCLMLENIRRGDGEETADHDFARKIAMAGDIFVQDAFADAHRSHASIVTVPKLLPSYAGLLVEEEVRVLSEALAPTHPALAIVGGAKFETKEPLLEKMLSLYDSVCLGGAIVNDYFRAQGFEVGESLVSEKKMPASLFSNTKLTTPTDVVVALGDVTRTSFPDAVQKGETIVDIGPATIQAWGEMICNSHFVVWNGPLGVYEGGFNEGTAKLAQAIVESGVRAVVGGGDTVAALVRAGFDEKKVFLSTGGGAMLEFLAKGTLPGLKALF
ncbi:MAG TPA: phosphoglycerate kinase [Candidatus Paceibacterota bacterium]